MSSQYQIHPYNGIGQQNLRETVVGELLLQGLYQGLSDVVDLVITIISNQLANSALPWKTTIQFKHQYIRFKLITLLNASSTSHGTNVNHSIAELNESTTLPGQLGVGNELENKVDQRLVLVLSQPLNEVVARQRLAETESSQAVLREAEVEHGGNIDIRGSKLLLLFHEVRAANLNHAR